MLYRVVIRNSESYSVSPRDGSVVIVPHETRVSLEGLGLRSHVDIDPRKSYTEFVLKVDGQVPKVEGNIKKLVTALYTVFEPQHSPSLV